MPLEEIPRAEPPFVDLELLLEEMTLDDLTGGDEPPYDELLIEN